MHKKSIILAAILMALAAGLATTAFAQHRRLWPQQWLDAETYDQAVESD